MCEKIFYMIYIKKLEEHNDIFIMYVYDMTYYNLWYKLMVKI